MKTQRVLLQLALVSATLLPALSQGYYNTGRITQRIAPLTRRAPAPAPAPAPQQVVPPTQYYTPNYSAPAPQAVRPLSPEESAKAQAQKEKNDEKQFEYFKRRADEGSDHAQYELGVRYLAGRGVTQDEKLGKEWLAKAAKNGNTPASRKLAELGIDPNKVDLSDVTKPSPKDAPAKTSEAKTAIAKATVTK